MQQMIVFLATQILVVCGLAGLFWPEKFVAAFEVLLYPWASSSRLVRLNSIASLGLAFGLAVVLILRTI
jgi:hypothetical protein